MSAFVPEPADDEVLSLCSYDLGSGGVDEEVDYEEMREQAQAAQRLCVSRLTRRYTKGRMEPAGPAFGRRMVAERVFRLPKLIEWLDGDPTIVVDAMREGRVRARLSAGMSVGKSTRLAPYIADMMNHRVLYVSVDAHAIGQVGHYIASSGIGRFRRRRASTIESRVCCMTYDDFNGVAMTEGRAEFFRSFETMVFDEGAVCRPDVEAAKIFFSTLAAPDTNLLVCSATVRNDLGSGSLESKAMGSFRELAEEKTVEQVIMGRRLVEAELVDRCMVVVPTDEQVEMLVNHYQDYGVDAKGFDSASTVTEEAEVPEWLRGDTTTPRVMVVHELYSLGYNFPVSYSIVWPQKEVPVLDGNSFRMKLVPMTLPELAQAKARTGRGIVDGSGGILMSPEISKEADLTFEQRFEVFVRLFAGSVVPNRIPVWEQCYALFPNGLTSCAAQTALKLMLPALVAVRFLGRDGRVAKKYSKAANVFAQPDHFLVESEDELPVSYHEWVQEAFVCSGDSGSVRVPYHTEGELQIVLQSISLIADGRFEISRWRNVALMEYYDGFDAAVTWERMPFDQKGKKGLRRVRSFEKKMVAAPPKRAIPWKYPKLREVEQPRRSGGIMDSDRMKEALRDLEKTLPDYYPAPRDPGPVVEVDGAVLAKVVPDPEGVVESPGGSTVGTLPMVICERMNTGEALNGKEMMQVVDLYRQAGSAFVASRLFDCFAGPWTSVLLALHDKDLLSYVVRKGVAPHTYQMLDCMRGRFNREVIHIISQSNVFKRRYAFVFKATPSIDTLMTEVRRGQFGGIAQTAGFIERIKFLKGLIDQALLQAETAGVWLGQYITEAQRMLPVHPKTGVGNVGKGMSRMPEGIGVAMHSQYESMDGGSPWLSEYLPKIGMRGRKLNLEWNFRK